MVKMINHIVLFKRRPEVNRQLQLEGSLVQCSGLRTPSRVAERTLCAPSQRSSDTVSVPSRAAR